jgi:hypothetical protein
VSSLVSYDSSTEVFCLFRPRPKKEAMLSGNAAERDSRGEIGGDVRGCDLHPGPDRSYLDGANIRVIGSERCIGTVVISNAKQSVVVVVVACL